MLVIVIDHDKDFVGSRHTNLRTESEIENFLLREFPGMGFDDILIVENDNIIHEWFNWDDDGKNVSF